MVKYEIPPLVADKISPRGKELIAKAAKFIEEECEPAETVLEAQMPRDPSKRFLNSYPPVIDTLKSKAKSLGLWNLFLSNIHYREGAPLSNLEYAIVAEMLGRCHIASEAMNCSAPDTGNMETIARYGDEAQKKRWLVPLLNGDIRSAIVMTERFVASSDAKNINLQIARDGDDYVLNGTKWWSSGAGDPRCKLYLVMGKTDPNHPDPYRQQSIVLVPHDAPGVTVVRALSVYGYDDAPHGHCEISFENVRVPASNLLLGEGRGFEIVQGRLGPGRIHHCMRSLGAASKALELMILRVNDPNRKTFGKLLSQHGTILEWIARSRIEIDAGRLLVLNAAHKIDASDAKGALKDISMAKIYVPSMSCAVIDRAVQAHGAGGICQDFPLARMWANQRTLRLADGPDEVHLNQLGRIESKKVKELQADQDAQIKRTEELMKKWGLVHRDGLSLQAKL